MEKSIKRKIKVMSSLTLIIIFMIGLMLIDYGATFKDANAYFQSLLFGRIEPRIVYHFGVILVLTTFFISQIIIVNEI